MIKKINDHTSVKTNRHLVYASILEQIYVERFKFSPGNLSLIPCLKLGLLENG